MEQYLGALITDECSEDEDVIRQMRSIYARDNALIRILNAVLKKSRHPYIRLIYWILS